MCVTRLGLAWCAGCEAERLGPPRSEPSRAGGSRAEQERAEPCRVLAGGRPSRTEARALLTETLLWVELQFPKHWHAQGGLPKTIPCASKADTGVTSIV